ncbi:hypothetical protein LQZ13_05535 [Leuconostoc mesenteroides]|uniref:hypothetical protein n=1 Tax=Leuconostoc mesenteroides TaxID=1245 RepID=UPI0021140E1C|nr:hypothetical protein [Leuconostoc mesenteroides]UUE16965.1 hypothetical protein LQZ13_05535 [Leuconostoc mesenteroides]
MKKDIFTLAQYWYIVLLIVIWIVFVSSLLSKKYLSGSKISLFKIYVAPILFLIFGIDKLVNFNHLLVAITFFLFITTLFSFIGAHLAYKLQFFHYHDNQLKFIGGAYGIFLMLTNIIIMLLLNFHSLVNPLSYNSWQYLIVYTLFGGSVKGLLIGQSVNIWWHVNFLKSKND